MNTTHITTIAAELSLDRNQVQQTADLFAEGATVPFIARYRKEATGSLDEVAVAAVYTDEMGVKSQGQKRGQP